MYNDETLTKLVGSGQKLQLQFTVDLYIDFGCIYVKSEITCRVAPCNSFACLFSDAIVLKMEHLTFVGNDVVIASARFSRSVCWNC